MFNMKPLCFAYFSLIFVALALCAKPVFSHEGATFSRITPSPRRVGIAADVTLPPGVTLLPPDWDDDAKVEVGDLGVIQGAANLTLPLMTAATRKFHWYAGIPYADPASYTGNNRFKPSKIWEGKKLNETGSFLATDYSIKCPQSGAGNTDGQKEECLIININVPTQRPVTVNIGEPLPVIFFIHGGSYRRFNSGIYRGHYFLNKDVIFVSINYRLGVLGSLNLGINDAPGNAALYDVVTALKWVKKYIGYFGGDKNKVTVAGHSAGSVLATHLLTSKLSIDEDGEPLLHGIIGLSGSSLGQTLATCTDPMKHHLRVSQLAGCAQESTQDIRNCLAQQPIKAFLDAMANYSNAEMSEGRFGLDAILPSLQDPSLTNPAITETPYAVLKQGKQLNIPIMMGTTKHDGAYLVRQTLEQFWTPHNYTNSPAFLRNHLLPNLLDALELKDDSGELIHSLERMYIGDAMYTDDFKSKIPGLIDIYSVLAFKAGAYNLVELHSKKNSSYYFSFEYSNGLCSTDNGNVIPGGVGHMDSLFYLFPSTSCLIALPWDVSLSNKFIEYWVNFATYGNPNGKGPKTIAAAYNSLNHAYLVIDGSDGRTAYYCRDAWIDNSLKLVEEPTTTPTTTDSGSDATTEEAPTTAESGPTETDPNTSSPSSTTPHSGTARTVNVNVALIICIIGYSLRI